MQNSLFAPVMHHQLDVAGLHRLQGISDSKSVSAKGKEWRELAQPVHPVHPVHPDILSALRCLRSPVHPGILREGAAQHLHDTHSRALRHGAATSPEERSQRPGKRHRGRVRPYRAMPWRCPADTNRQKTSACTLRPARSGWPRLCLLRHCLPCTKAFWVRCFRGDSSRTP